MKIKWEDFTIVTKYLGDKPAPWNNENVSNYNHNKVIIKRGGHQVTFSVWGSMVDPDLRMDILGIFGCILGDAMAGQESFCDFCMNFGYDEDSRKAERAWKDCIKTRKRISRVIDDDELFDIYRRVYEEV